jgi:hypothetical protein
MCCFYYVGAYYCGFLLWCFIWVDLAHAYTMFDSNKSPYNLYDHLDFDLWYHFMLWLMMFCRYAWLAIITLLFGRSELLAFILY